MTPTTDLASDFNLPTSVNGRLDRYVPRRTYSGQWPRLRDQVLALVRSMEPASEDRALVYLSALGYVLETEIESLPSGSLGDLLTDQSLNRAISRFNQAGRSRKATQSLRATLTQLHRMVHDLPPVIAGVDQVRVVSEPINDKDLNDFLLYVEKTTSPMALHLTRRLILALGAGLTGSEADASRIEFNDGGISAVIDGEGRRVPFTRIWFDRLNSLAEVGLEGYQRPSVQALASWLRKRDLSYLWPRMRDEWLLEQLDGSQSAFHQLRKAQITEYDTNRLLLRWAQMPIEMPMYLLRNRTVFVPDECEEVGAVHRFHQPLNLEGLEKESGSAMDASTKRKITKAQARRMSAAHALTVSGISTPISKEHAGILSRYVPVAARSGDREKCRLAIIAVMERTAHIKSKACFLKNCSDVSNLAAWCAETGRDLSWDSLMCHEIIHDYLRSLGTAASTTHHSQRLRRLKVLASHLNPGISAPPRVEPVGHKVVADPYSAAEMAAICRVAATQQNPNLTRQLAFILAACRGAGAGSEELRDLHRFHIVDQGDDGILITLGKGEHKRTVPVRREWEAHMRIGISGLARSSLAVGTVKNRRNIAGDIVERARSAGNLCPHIDASRLRTTWIAELMSEAIPVQVILNASGLKSARTLTELARKFSQNEINDLFGVLRGVAK